MKTRYLVYEKNPTAGREIKATCPTLRDAKKMLFFLKKISPDSDVQIIPSITFKNKEPKDA